MSKLLRTCLRTRGRLDACFKVADRGNQLGIGGILSNSLIDRLSGRFEGNYLLLDEDPWVHIRSLLDESWFLQPDETERIDWLVQRHVRHGRSSQDARDWANTAAAPLLERLGKDDQARLRSVQTFGVWLQPGIEVTVNAVFRCADAAAARGLG